MRYYPKDDPDSRIRHYPEDGPDFCGEEESEEESLFQKQAWFVIGIACLLCAGLILYSLFFTGPKVWEGAGLPEVSSLASGVSAVFGYGLWDRFFLRASGKAGPEHGHPRGIGRLAGNRAGKGGGHPPISGRVRPFPYRRGDNGGRGYRGENIGTSGHHRGGGKLFAIGRFFLGAQEKLDLNTATQEELDALPGIGPVKAEAILQYREESGPFRTVEEIMEVEGIGEKTLEQLRPLQPSEEKLDLNTATQEELDALPGIGPVKAEAILQYREESGPFRTVEEIMEVKGIGEKTLEQLRPYVTVEGEPSSPPA